MKKKSQQKTLAMVTGGLDSTTMVYSMKRDGVDARLLYIDFGTPAAVREKAAVKLFALYLDCPLDILDLSGFATLNLGYLWPSIVSGPELDVGRPSEAKFPIGRADRRLSSGFGVIASAGLYAAMLLDRPSLSLAITREQFEMLPDLSNGLNAATKLAAAVNPGLTTDIVTPLANMKKEEIVQRAIQVGVPINMTWSCMFGGEQPCGKCERCITRKEAIATAGVKIDTIPAIDPPSSIGDASFTRG